MGSEPLPDLFSGLEAEAVHLEAFGALGPARATRETLRLIREQLTVWWNEPLSMADAAEWGGYSEGQLRRLIRECKVAVAPNGGIRRRDVPVQPGHRLPLGLEPAPVATGDVIANLVERRQIGRAG
jgi:hypothetical protein